MAISRAHLFSPLFRARLDLHAPQRFVSLSLRCIVSVFLAELSSDQIMNLRRREALAYESDVFEQAAKERQSDANQQEKVDSQLRLLRKTVSHVKVTCEALTTDE